MLSSVCTIRRHNPDASTCIELSQVFSVRQEWLPHYPVDETWAEWLAFRYTVEYQQICTRTCMISLVQYISVEEVEGIEQGCRPWWNSMRRRDLTLRLTIRSSEKKWRWGQGRLGQSDYAFAEPKQFELAFFVQSSIKALAPLGWFQNR